MHQVGETILTGNCTRLCECKEFGAEAECEEHDCGENAVCIVENGEETCSCIDEHVLIDGECRGEFSVSGCLTAWAGVNARSLAD